MLTSALIESMLADCSLDEVETIIEAALPGHSIDTRAGRKIEKRFRQVATYYGRLWSAYLTEETVSATVRHCVDLAKSVRESESIQERKVSADELFGVRKPDTRPISGRKVTFDEMIGAKVQDGVADSLHGTVARVKERAIPGAESAFKQAVEHGYETSWNGKRALSIEKARTFARGNAARLCDDLSKADMKRIGRTIADGIMDGSTIQQMTDTILEITKSDQMTAERAKSIATTEANNALNAGAFMAADDLGHDEKAWIDVGDEKVCDVCSGNAAQGAIPIGDEFESGDMFPPAHPNDRCYIRTFASSAKGDSEE
jgi:SPP1 gp7 family putative phage head morphogenesis protein